MTHRRIRLRLGLDHQWRFQPIAANGEPQATSEPYPTERNARRGAADLFPDEVLAFMIEDERPPAEPEEADPS